MKRTWIETVSAYLTLLGIGNEYTIGGERVKLFVSRGIVTVTPYLDCPMMGVVEADDWCKEHLGATLSVVLAAVDKASRHPNPLPTELEEQTIELSDSAHCTV